jgi:hypothetical protein
MLKKKLLTDRTGELQQKIIDEAAERLSKDIDFEVMMSVMIESGWTKVVLNPMTWEDSYAVDEWVSKNVKGNFDTRGLVWIFKDPKDATWFKLRWLSQ